MPRPEDLPETLKPLARRNAMRLTHEGFRADAQGFIDSIDQALERISEHHKAKERQRQLEEERRREEARLKATAGLSAEQIAVAETVAAEGHLNYLGRSFNHRGKSLQYEHGSKRLMQ